MDMAVALVQAYLRLNGYLTVVEYPIVEALGKRRYRTLTDLDLLAFRFPGAGRAVGPWKGHAGGFRDRFRPDPVLGADPDRADMIIGEVKEGVAELNRAARNPAVLEAALRRFGCCPAEALKPVVQHLLSKGQADLPAGHRVRLIAFGSKERTESNPPCHIVPLGHVIETLEDFIEENWELLKSANPRDPALSLLLIREKGRRGAGGEAD